MATKTKGVDRGKARRSGPNGEIYCAPFCGRGCTYAQYQYAVSMGDMLAAEMGDGWNPRVWENLGWHWCVTSPSGFIHVHPHSFRKGVIPGYTAFINDRPNEPGGKWTAQHKTPQGAVKRARIIVRNIIANLDYVLHHIDHD